MDSATATFLVIVLMIVLMYKFLMIFVPIVLLILGIVTIVSLIYLITKIFTHSREKCPNCESKKGFEILDENWYDSKTTTTNIKVAKTNQYRTMYTKTGSIIPSYSGKRRTVRYKNETIYNTVDEYIVAVKCAKCSELYTVEMNSNNLKLKKYFAEKQAKEDEETTQMIIESKQQIKEQAKENLLNKYKIK